MTNQELSKRATQVLKGRFAHYQDDSVMAAPQVANYLQDMGREEWAKEDLEVAVVQFIEEYGTDGPITQKDFLGYYSELCQNDLDTAWLHMKHKKFGLGDDLSPVASNVELNSLSELPRASIANNITQLKMLFALGPASDLVWSVISSLKTNSDLYFSVLVNNEEFLSNLPQMPLYQLLYTL